VAPTVFAAEVDTNGLKLSVRVVSWLDSIVSGVDDAMRAVDALDALGSANATMSAAVAAIVSVAEANSLRLLSVFGSIT
jgi:hypothetical protein